MTRVVGWTGTLLSGVLLLSAPAQAEADGRAAFDRGMAPLVEAYLTMQVALAADQSAGVQAAAEQVAALARKLDRATVTGQHAAQYKELPSKLSAAGTALSKLSDLELQRKAFKELSKPMALWVTLSAPPGLDVVYCSMAPGSWLQRTGTPIANPYYGAKMLRCGEVVAGPGKGQKGGHR